MPLSLDRTCIVQRTPSPENNVPWSLEMGERMMGRQREQKKVLGPGEGRGVDRKNWGEEGDQGRWLFTDKPGWVWRRCFVA